MDRLFRIDFYPQDWVIKTGKMTVSQRGLYIQVCSLIYAHRGPIENDPVWIGRVSNCSTRLARTLIAQLVAAGSLQVRGSKITQERCERELNIKRSHIEASTIGGRNSAEKRALSRKDNDLGSSGRQTSLPTSAPAPKATATATATAIAIAAGQDINNRSKGVTTDVIAKSAKPGDPGWNPESHDGEVLPGAWEEAAAAAGVNGDRTYQSWTRFKAVSDRPFDRKRWSAWLARERR